MISQREARRLRKRVERLESILQSQRRTYGQEFHGVNIATLVYDDPLNYFPQSVRVARKLGHMVVVVGDETGNLRLMALPHPSEKP